MAKMQLTQSLSKAETMKNQITSGFWETAPFVRHFPPAITEVSEYDGGSSVNVSCTQLIYANERTKRRILKEWIEAIPSLPARMVRFSCHVPEPLLVAICGNPSIRGLYIKWTKSKSVEALRSLNHLEQLYLGNAAGIDDATPIMSLENLKVLSVENLKKITNYSFLQCLSRLESLSIVGGMYSRPIINDLQFVSKLTQLRSFSLVAMRCRRPSLEPFWQLKQLVNLSLCCDFPDEEKKQLEAQLPNLRYGFEYYRKLQERNLAKTSEEFERQV